LEEMRDAPDLGAFVARAGLDEEADRDRLRRGTEFADDGEAVGEGVVVEGHGFLESGVRGQRSEVRGQRSEVRESSRPLASSRSARTTGPAEAQILAACLSDTLGSL